MPTFLLACAQAKALEQFRIPELYSVAKCLQFSLRLITPFDDSSRPFMLAELASEHDARLLASRAVSLRAVYELWAHADTLVELHELVKSDSRHLWTRMEDPEASWSFHVDSVGRSIAGEDQLATIDSFKYLAPFFAGPMRLKHSKESFGCLFEHDASTATHDTLAELRHIFFGRRIAIGQRALVDRFDLKKRAYVGNTSMESEVSLYMANQSLAAPGKLVYDPFTGTGSMLLTASHFGAYAMGSDIDPRPIRGNKKSTFAQNAEQYGLGPRLIDSTAFDFTQHPWRRGELFDAIITDPPYGVRAGAKRLGCKDPQKAKEREQPTLVPNDPLGRFTHQMPDWMAATKPLEMEPLMHSLLTYSRWLLKPGGRLVYFVPLEDEQGGVLRIPDIEGMKVVAVSDQHFTRWTRRLVTMEKTGGDVLPEQARGIQREVLERQGRTADDFRERYFAAFRKPGDDANETR